MCYRVSLSRGLGEHCNIVSFVRSGIYGPKRLCLKEAELTIPKPGKAKPKEANIEKPNIEEKRREEFRVEAVEWFYNAIVVLLNDARVIVSCTDVSRTISQ